MSAKTQDPKITVNKILLPKVVLDKSQKSAKVVHEFNQSVTHFLHIYPHVSNK
jgi:hypothetical protein